jgi:glycine cleavage system H lipoate-binding protein
MEERHHIQCWWMLAGVVGYKLCDREFDCEHCPFDKVIHDSTYRLPRKSALETETFISDKYQDMKDKSRAGALINTQDYGIADMLFYHPAHIWVSVEEEGCVRVGLDGFGQKVLGRIYSVSLPLVGSNVQLGEDCWRITHQFGVTNLITPVAGVVRQINTKLTQYPSLLNRKPYGEGWAFLIEPTDLKACLKQLFYGQKVKSWYKREIEKLYWEANELLNEASVTTGQTMPDGGTLKEGFMSELTTEQMRKLIGSFFPVPLTQEQEKMEESNDYLAILDKKWR